MVGGRSRLRSVSQREQIGELFRRIGNYHMSHWKAGSKDQDPLKPSNDPHLEKAAYLYQKACGYLRKPYLAESLLGVALMRLGQLDDAIRVLRRATSRNYKGGTASAWYHLGLAHARLVASRKLTPEQIKTLKVEEHSCYAKAVAQDHDHWGAQYNLAYMCAELGHRDALEALENSFRISREKTCRELGKKDDAAVFEELQVHLKDNEKVQLKEMLARCVSFNEK